MLKQLLEDVTETDLADLNRSQIPESVDLEFKRQLNLSDEKEKAEAAKDVSAMANSVGGHILYGIDEITLTDGRKVAGPIVPMSDGDAQSRLENVLLSTIHPRPRLRLRMVPVTGGYVLVVEVYPAFASDLHMVTGFSEYRFYRRGEQRTIKMEEPEIREAYGRIAASRQALEVSLELAMERELKRVPKTAQSVLVIPWYGRRDLVDPRRLGRDLGPRLATGPLRNNEWRIVAPDLRIESDGYRAVPNDDGAANALLYMSVNRTGLIHFADDPFGPSPRAGEHQWIRITECLSTILATVITARHILHEVAYWGPVRIIHELRLGSPTFLINVGEESHYEFMKKTRKALPSGKYRHEVPETNLRHLGISLRTIYRELLDQIFQTRGDERCPWFDDAGGIVNASIEEGLRQRHLLEHVSP